MTQGQGIERTVKIRRCAAVVKGGRRFSFAAMVVVGNGNGRAGWGYGKANEVPPSVEKATKQASREQVDISVTDGTIPHVVKGRYGAGRVILIPAGPGTGIIAGAAVRSPRGAGRNCEEGAENGTGEENTGERGVEHGGPQARPRPPQAGVRPPA